ncbi:MAG: SRPBCC domain-containing protein [Chloroflexota bacterium]
MSESSRRSSAARVINAAPAQVYAAWVDPELLISWLPPGDMTGKIHAFDARIGGGYQMSLYYPGGDASQCGKTSEHEDVVHVRFVDLQPARRIVQAVTFDSPDPSFAGEMTMTISFDLLGSGTRVSLDFRDLPPGLRPEDNDAGARISLDQLARLFP